MSSKSIRVTADDGMTFEIPNDEEFRNASPAQKQAIAAQYHAQAKNPVKSQKDDPWYVDVGQYLERNLDVVTGPALGVAAGIGVTALTANPILGIAAGMAAGGAGTYGGVVLSDYIADEKDKNDSIHYKATQAALTSIGIDAATLGLGKILKPGYFAAKKALGFTPEETAEEIVKLAERGMADAGTTESLRASQAILQEGSETGRTATLLPTQLGEEGASFTQRFSQSLAESGYLSSGDFIRNGEAINEIVSDNLTTIFNKSGQEIALDPSNLGRQMESVIQMGKDAASSNYGRSLDKIRSLVGNKNVATKPLVQVFQNFLDKGRIVGLEGAQTLSTLSPTARSYIQKVINDLSEVNVLPAQSLLAVEKALASEIRDLGNIANINKYDSRASGELLELSTAMKDTVSKQLESLSSEASTIYAATKNEYAKNMGGILPKINSSYIARANLGPNTQGNYEALGNMLLQTKAGGNNDQLRAFFRSIDQSFAVSAKDIAARKAAGEEVGASGITFTTAKQAKQAIRQGYLKKLFPNLGGDFDINQYAKIQKSFQDPKQAERLKIVFGEDYNSVKQLSNLMAEASVRGDGSNFGSLMIQARQLSAAGATVEGAGVIGSLGLYVADADPTAYLGAAAVLLTPKVLSKIVLNPAKVNRLLALSKQKFPTEEAFAAAALKVVESVMSDMSEQERNELKNEFSMTEKDGGI